MNKIRERAQLHFPAVLLTLISIIQALALELMWSRIVSSDFLWGLDMPALLGWGMMSVSLMGIILIWVLYTTLVMGFVWQPSLRDSVLPFLIGIQEFMMLSFVDAEFRGMWLYMLASLFVSVNWIIHISLRRSRQHPANAQYFSTIAPANLRDFLPSILVIGVAVLLGLVIDLSGNRNWLPLLAILFANSVLLIQILITRRLWQSLMADSPVAPDVDGSSQE